MSESTYYLALQEEAAPGLRRVAATYIRWRLKTVYHHAGIVKDGILYDITSAGLHARPMPTSGWIYLPLNRVALDAQTEFEAMHSWLKYDFISLFVFLLPVKFHDNKRMYCYEWCWYLMTGKNPTAQVTPEMLLIELTGANRD